MPDPREWFALIQAAAQDFAFGRPQDAATVDEAARYLQALIAHVDSRDLARGFELRVGTKQADWTPDMVERFQKWMMNRPRRDPDQFQKALNVFKVATVKVSSPIDEVALRRFVDRTLEYMIDVRREHPAAELPLLVGGLTTDAELLTTTVDRGDRIAFITAMARNKPLYGWYVASDMFIHSIDVGEVKRASKQDAIGIHFGTRTVRGFLVQPYNVVDGVVQLLPAREDLFQSGAHVEDPYAFVFAPHHGGAVVTDETRKLTPDQVADQQRGATRLGAGLWVDRHGHLHISIVELLEAFGLDDTPAERAAVERIIRERFSLPLGATIIRQEPE